MKEDGSVAASAQPTWALLVQDMQNDVISAGGAFAESGAPGHANDQNVVTNVSRLASAARRAGVPVIHIWFIVEPGAQELKANAPLFEGVRDAAALVRGSWGAAPVEGLAPEDGDLIVEKGRMNAFHDTRLDSILRGLGVDRLVLTGAWTNMSVEHTARHGADAGYEIVICTDGCSSINEEWHQAALSYALTNICNITTCDDVAKSFS